MSTPSHSANLRLKDPARKSRLQVAAGPFNGLLITANLLASLTIDHFGWIRMPVHRAGPLRIVGALLMVGGIVLIAFR